MRILITGSRDVDAHAERIVFGVVQDAVATALKVTSDVVVVHGGARGVDTVAAFSVPALMLERHPADWQTHGKRAGVLRNLHMVELGADVCLAFPRRSSVGTWHCIRAAADAGIPVRIYPLPEIPS